MKDVLTTGEVARLCGVAPRTVSKWFDTGQLRGYKIPGSRDRRIPRDTLIRFMRAHGIPLRGLVGAVTRVLFVDGEYQTADLMRVALEHEFDYEVQIAVSVFEAGLVARQFRPHIIFLSLAIAGLDPQAMLRAVRSDPELVASRIVALDPTLTQERATQHLSAGFDACLAKPYTLRTIVEAVERATDIVS